MTKKKRMANLELLRCFAMMMVIVLHYLGKGNILPEMASGGAEDTLWLGMTGSVAWLLEAFCIVAVNVYMLISGYFLSMSSFRPSRLIQLWLQLWTYSVVFGVIGSITGVIAETSVDTHYYLTLLFPVTMEHYWFMTAYIFLYLLLPLVGTAVKRMTEGQLKVTVVVLLSAFCLLKSLMPFRMEMDRHGYDCLWYLCVFVTAAYIRRFGLPFLQKKRRAISLYIIGCLLTFAGTYCLRFIFLRTGSLSRMVTMCMEYNHVLPFLAALGLFVCFLRIEIPEKVSGVINWISPCTLGVYLLHENLGLRYSWQRWLGSERITGLISLGLWTVLAVVVVFSLGVVIEKFRSGLMRMLHSVLMKLGIYRRLVERITSIDNLFCIDNRE